MTWFNKLTKPIVVNCYTNRYDVAEYSPIRPAAKFYPEWWKKIPKEHIESTALPPMPTMKGCAGFMDMYSTGVMLPLWCDLALTIGARGTGAYEYRFSDQLSSADVHPVFQRGDFMPEFHFQHLKLVSPWMLKCDEENLKFLCTEPTWSLEHMNSVRVLPGVVNFKYQHAISPNTGLLRDAVDKLIVIPFGTPIMHIIPLTEREVQFNVIHDPVIYHNLAQSSAVLSFSRKYFNKIKAIKQND